jgi:hypothetical protein
MSKSNGTITKMKQLKTILGEASQAWDPHEHLADAEMRGEISLRTYYRAAKAEDLSRSEARATLREAYQRAGRSHLCPA